MRHATAFVFAAIMSMIVAKFFCDLALAAPPHALELMEQGYGYEETFEQASQERAPKVPLDEGAKFLGTFEVQDIRQASRAYKGTVCKPHRVLGDLESPNRDCGTEVWVFKKESRSAREAPALTFVKANPKRGFLSAFLLIGGECDSAVNSEETREGIFESPICRALQTRKLGKKGFDTFVFYEGLDQAASSIMASLLTTGIPMGAETSYKIRVPKGAESPDTIVVEENIVGSVFFIPAQLKKTYTLTRVSE